MTFWPASISGSGPASAAKPAYRLDRMLVQPKPLARPEAVAGFHAAHNAEPLQTFEGIGGLQILELPQGRDIPELISQYEQSGLFAFAEPDYISQAMATSPNDPDFTNGTLWGLNKIDAPGGWDWATSASNIVVAVLDTGVRYTHEDLATNMWVNPNDGSHGLNVIAGNTDPSDDNTHGTMVAGVLGAVGNNGKGVVGVAWRVQIMACVCISATLSVSISDCITCLDYARTNNARLINASWGFSTNSLALSNAVYSLRSAGIILVAACGNSSADLDASPNFPSGYDLDNVVSVASTGAGDALSSFSNYGATTVHLAAPGENIWSTFPATDSYYYFNSGTSFSAPYVTGALALLLARFPGDSYLQTISRLLNGTDPLPSLAGKCTSGGRLNLRKALSPVLHLSAAPRSQGSPFQIHGSGDTNQTWVIQSSPDLSNWSAVSTNMTSVVGAFDFADASWTNANRRFYRAVTKP